MKFSKEVFVLNFILIVFINLSHAAEVIKTIPKNEEEDIVLMSANRSKEGVFKPTIKGLKSLLNNPNMNIDEFGNLIPNPDSDIYSLTSNKKNGKALNVQKK